MTRSIFGRARDVVSSRVREVVGECARGDTGGIGINVAIGVLLVIPFVALLWVSSYAKAKPTLWGFPFFYWYQLLWVLISAALTVAAYLLVRGLDRRRSAAASADARRREAEGGGHA